MGLDERTVNGVLGLGATNAPAYVGSLVVQLVLTRFLLPEMFGVVALALAVRKIASIPANWGLGEAIMQETDHDAFLETLLWVRIAFATGFVAVAVGGGLLFRQFFRPTIVNVFVVPATSNWFKMVGDVFRGFRQRELGLSMLGVVDLLALVIAVGRRSGSHSVGKQSGFWCSTTASENYWRPSGTSPSRRGTPRAGSIQQ